MPLRLPAVVITATHGLAAESSIHTGSGAAWRRSEVINRVLI